MPAPRAGVSSGRWDSCARQWPVIAS